MFPEEICENWNESKNVMWRAENVVFFFILTCDGLQSEFFSLFSGLVGSYLHVDKLGQTTRQDFYLYIHLSYFGSYICINSSRIGSEYLFIYQRLKIILNKCPTVICKEQDGDNKVNITIALSTRTKLETTNRLQLKQKIRCG